MSSLPLKALENMDGPFLVQSCGVDWITCTGTTTASWNRVWKPLAEYTDFATRAGCKLRRTMRNGYKLSSIEGAEYGRGPQGWMVVLKGHCAQRLWRVIAAYAKNVTRLDMQATISYRDYQGDEIRKMSQLMHDEKLLRPKLSRVLILNGLKGDTQYIGRRTSAQMGRCYDKYKQSNKSDEYLHCIRFEVEYKKPLSGEVCTWLLGEDPNSERIVSHVLRWFDERQFRGPQLYAFTDGAIQFPTKEIGPNRQLAWLRTQVRPTYQQLKLQGYGVEADEALGLVDDATNIIY